MQMIFFPDADEEKSYSLGTIQSPHAMDLQPLVNPILEAGWEVTNHDDWRGGTRSMTIFRHPGMIMDDWIKWDPRYDSSSPVFASLALRADARRGSSYTLTAGFFRMVCTNGMISQQLGMGYLNFRHGDDPAQVQDNVAGFLSGLGRQNFEQRVFKKYDVQSAQWIRNLLASDETDHPTFIGTPFNTLTSRLKGTEREELAAQMDLILSGGESTMTVMDLLNAYTNVVRRPSQILRLEPAINSFTSLAEIGDAIYHYV
jgi:hypothetical protein